jgi:hypothetical protein
VLRLQEAVYGEDWDTHAIESYPGPQMAAGDLSSAFFKGKDSFQGIGTDIGYSGAVSLVYGQPDLSCDERHVDICA